MRRFATRALVPAAAALLAAAPGAVAQVPSASETTVSLRDAQGRDVGEARLVDTPNGVLIHVDFRDLPPGEHGFHVHETGRCEPDFSAAGDHFAPKGSSHGFLREEGPHAGDLVNLVVAQDGTVRDVVRAPDTRLADLADADGSALVVHSDPDDYASQPSGASGDRIACGVIAEPKAAAER